MNARLPLVGTLLMCLSFGLFAQKASPPSQKYFDLEPNGPASSARYVPGTPSLPQPLAGNCTSSDILGSASNVYTQILTEARPVAVDDDLNSILFLHRNNATTFGGHSGNLRYDLSTNAGLTWASNAGPVNPTSVNGTNAARYPNVSIYNPAGNTNPNNAYLSYIAATVGSTWNGAVSGVRKLDGTGNTENYNQTGATQTLIPRAMVKGAPGVFWSIDAVWNGTAISGYRIYKGTWNGSNDVVWTVNTTLTPTFNTLFDGAVHTSDFSMAFDPTGTYGWVCLLTHVTPGASGFTFYPVFYKTTDGGVTWSGPEQVDLMQFPCISSNIAQGNIATAAFDLSMTVDVNGDPHAFMAVGNGNNAYAIFFANWTAMVDLTRSNGLWNPIILDEVWRGRGTWGTAPNQVTLDMGPQAAHSPDGSKVFFTWVDADSSVIQATADQSPNLYAKAYDVNTHLWTDTYDMSSCNATWNGKILFPKLAETVLSNSGNYKLAVVFAELGLNDNPLNPANFHYLDSIYFTPADFTFPQCSVAVSLAPTDTITVCGNTTLDAGPGGQAYAWSDGSITQTISVSASGSYSVGVSNGCCTGGDTVYVQILAPPASSFTSTVNGTSASFSNTSTGGNTSFFWDFGDGNTSTMMSPTHAYATPGSYTTCLTVTNACGSDSTCSTVVATCPPATSAWSTSNAGLTVSFSDMTVGNPTSWNWAFGDGNSSSNQNPTHTYTMAGTYTVCLAITDSCGSDTLCQLISVCAAPVAAFSYTLGGLAVVDFMDISSGGTTWFWDFGDGNTSTLQNPSHSYAGLGSYTACLTVSDSCGTDTSCQQVLVLDAIEDVLGEGWQVYPVPASESAWLQARDVEAGELHWQLSNMLGQTIKAGQLFHSGGEFKQQLDLEGLGSGVYFVRLQGDHGKIVLKLLKE